MAKVLIYAMMESLGGVEEYVLNLTRYASGDPKDKYGYITLGRKSLYKDEMEKYRVDHYFVSPKKNLIRNIKELNLLLKKCRNEYDTFYINTSGLYYPIPYLLALKYKYRIVLHSHLCGEKNIKYIFHLINRIWINKIVSKRFACSTPAAEWMFGKEDNTYTIIPNAINLKRFKFDSNVRSAIRKKIGVEDAIVIGNIGRLCNIKNQQFMLEIMRKFSDRKENVKLVLVGDGENRELLQNTAEKYGISNNIVFWGQTTEPEKVMNAFDCFIMTSHAEGFPITMMEIQANGLPAVISDKITKEVDISGCVNFLPLDVALDEWCDVLIKMSTHGRNDNMQSLKSMGYDVFDLENRLWKLLHE